MVYGFFRDFADNDSLENGFSTCPWLNETDFWDIDNAKIEQKWRPKPKVKFMLKHKFGNYIILWKPFKFSCDSKK